MDHLTFCAMNICDQYSIANNREFLYAIIHYAKNTNITPSAVVQIAEIVQDELKKRNGGHLGAEINFNK